MIVVDTNVLAYLVLPSPFTAAVEKLHRQDSDWIAPRLWRSEMRNVLSLYLRKGLLGLDESVRLLEELEDLMQDKSYDLPSLDVLRFAHASGCSAYDCEFIALADQFHTSLITMDRKLARAFPQHAKLLTEAVP